MQPLRLQASLPISLILLLVLFRSGVVATRFQLVNKTIDDTAGDSETRIKPEYLPKRVWQNAESCVEGVECALRPDNSFAFDRTWTTGVYKPGQEDLSITLEFHGTAIYVYFILFNNAALPFVTESKFILDGSSVGHFYHEPATMSNSQYSYHENALAFSKNGLANDDHTLVITTAGADHEVLINFDYAIYTTETEVYEGDTISTSQRNLDLLSTKFKRATMDAAPAIHSRRSSNVGTIIGAIIGIMVFLGIAAATIILYLKRRKRIMTTRDGRSISIHQQSSWYNDTGPSSSTLPQWTRPVIPSLEYHGSSARGSENSEAMYGINYPSVSPFHADFDNEMEKKGANEASLRSHSSPSTSNMFFSTLSVENNPILVPASVITPSNPLFMPDSTSSAHGASLSMTLTPSQNKRRSRQLLPVLPPPPDSKESEETVREVEAEVREWQNETRVSKPLLRHVPDDSWPVSTEVDKDDQSTQIDGKDKPDKMNLLNQGVDVGKKYKQDPLSLRDKKLPLMNMSPLANSSGNGRKSRYQQYPPIAVPLTLMLRDSALVNRDFMSEDRFVRLPYQQRQGKRGNRYTFDDAVSIQMAMLRANKSKIYSSRGLSRTSAMTPVVHTLTGRASGSVKPFNEMFQSLFQGNDFQRSSRKSCGGKPSVKKTPLEKELRIQRRILRDSSDFRYRPSRGPYRSKAQRRADQRMIRVEASIHRRIFIDDIIIHNTLRSRPGSQLDTLTAPTKGDLDNLFTPFSPPLHHTSNSQSVSILSQSRKLSILPDRVAFDTSRHLSPLHDPLQLLQPHSHFMKTSSALQIISWTLELIFRHRRISYSRSLKWAIEDVERLQVPRTDVAICVLKFLMKSLIHPIPSTKTRSTQLGERRRSFLFF